MSAICRNRALCVMVSVLNKCTMAQNSVADMVIEVSNVGGATSGIGGVARGSVDVASSIDGDGVVRIGDAAGTSGTNSMGCSSYCGCSVCGGTGDAGLGSTTTGVE